nr:MAG TPA: hypothetical protein [Caudoviricetes sp.]
MIDYVCNKNGLEIAVDIIKHTDKLSIDDFTYVCDLILLKSYSFISEV